MPDHYYLYDTKETPIVRYLSFVAKKNRYDFGIVFTQQFEGKSIVMSLQTMKWVFMAKDDLYQSSSWLERLGVDPEDEESIKGLFQNVLYHLDSLRPQYDEEYM